MKKIILLFVLSICFLSFQVHAQQNVSISDVNSTPDASSVLDINSTTKGLLIPRVELTATNIGTPITLPATSMLVYNTATAGLSPNNVIPGYYYNAGTPAAPNWLRMNAGSAGGTEWKLLGNSGTNASSNFLGTIDAVDLVFRTNNTEKMRVLSGGNVGIGTATPAQKLDVVGNLQFSQALMPNGQPGTSGQVLISQGANTAPIFTNLGSLNNIVVLTSNGTYTPTTGTSKAYVIMVGGGGGGGGANANGAIYYMASGGGGGGGGQEVHALINVTSSTSCPFTIGAAGSGGTPATCGTLTAGSGNGTTGGNTTFTVGATTFTAAGGNGGVISVAITIVASALGGAGGNASNPTAILNIPGETGGTAQIISSALAGNRSWTTSGAGANSKYGAGGYSVIPAQSNSVAGIAGIGYGTGGSGAGGYSFTAANQCNTGGNGRQGVIIVYEFK